MSRARSLAATAGAKAGRLVRAALHGIRHPTRRGIVLTLAAIPVLSLAYTLALIPFTPRLGDIRKARVDRPALILSADGYVLAEFKPVNREWVTLNQISPNVVNALIATEDHRFNSDPGVDPLAMARVAVSWITGREDQGGSTIDQQLAKNLYTGGHSGFTNDLKQLAIAVKLNQAYSRPEILRMYAEVAYYGHGYYGLRAASCGYFGRTPDRLTLVQAAMLAGVVNAPTYDDPLVYPRQARTRLVHVIGRMAAVGYLTQAQETAALDAPLGLSAVRGCQ